MMKIQIYNVDKREQLRNIRPILDNVFDVTFISV